MGKLLLLLYTSKLTLMFKVKKSLNFLLKIILNYFDLVESQQCSITIRISFQNRARSLSGCTGTSSKSAHASIKKVHRKKKDENVINVQEGQPKQLKYASPNLLRSQPIPSD